MRLRAIALYFEKLADGDAVAWGLTVAALIFLAFVALVAWRSWRDEKKWQERQRKKRGQSLPVVGAKSLKKRGEKTK